MKTRRDWRTPLGLFAAALVLRALPAASVFSEGEVFLRDPDAYYHLRRVLYAIVNFPAALSFDPYVQFPHGAKIIWPVFFDSLLASLLWPVHRLGGEPALEVAAAWVPPLLGAATVVLTWAVARRHFGPRAALWSAALLCVLGGHFVYSRLGAFDHHVAVSLISAALLGAVLRAVDAGAPPHGLRAPASVGVFSGIALLIWPGAILYAGIALLTLSATALLESDRAAAAARFRGLAVAAACSIALVAPFCLGAEWPQWSAMSPVVLSGFQPWILGCAVALGAAGVALCRHLDAGASRPTRFALLTAAGAALLGASLLLSADLARGFADAWQWLGRGESFQASVIESQPLFVVRGKLSGYMATLQLSPLVYAFPLIWIYGWFEARRAPNRRERSFLLVWSGALCCVALLQKRFLDTFSIAFALQTGLAAADLWRRAGVQPESIPARLAGAATLLALYPLHANYTPHLDNLLRAFQGETLRLSTFHRANRILVGASHWLERYTPTTSGWLDASRQPEYGVMAPWSAGHIVQHVGRRPTVADNFGDDAGATNFRLERRFWAAPAAEADAMLEELDVRYVLVTGGDPRLRHYDHFSTYRALFRRDGSGIIASAGQASTRGRGRYRMRMESQRLEPDSPHAFVKVYEFVRGARLRGTTRPGQSIGLSVAIDTNRNRRFHYRDRVRSDADGKFEFVVPYANTGDPAWVDVAPRYALRCGLATGWAEVSDRQVRGGATVRVDDPCDATPVRPAARRGPPRARQR